MATTYISKINQLGGSDVYVIKDSEAIQSIATGDNNGQIKVTPRSGNAYNISIKGLGSNAFNSTTYLPLAGGTLTGNLGFKFGNTDKHIIFDYDGDETPGASWRIAALGSGTGNTNYFTIQSGTSTISATDWNNVIRLSQDTFEAGFGGNVYPLENSTKTLGTSSLKWANVYATTFTGALSGNATTATGFASAKSITLTGDITGSATGGNESNGWSIATTLANSGVTANIYGNTSQQTPSHGGTFNIPYFKVDAKGRITQAGTTTVKLPADSNTDTKVTQNNTTAANDYRILLSTSANDNAETNTINKNTNLRYNPSTNTLSTGNITGTGSLNITGNANLNSETYAASVTAGSLLVNGNTNFVQIPTAPTPAATSNDTSVATTAFVMNAFTANDAMVFKGVINANGDLPATHKQGWTYRVATAGTYAGKVCEVGDIIICVTDGTTANNDHWAIIQNNVDGAVYRGTNAFTDANIIVADSTNGKVKSSGKTITTTAPSSSAADTTIPTSKAVWSAISGASGYGKTGTVTSITINTTSPISGGSTTATTTSGTYTISLADGYGDTKNPYGTKTANYILAGPSSGNAAAPTFRKLVAADIPSLTKSKISDFPTNISTFTNDSGYVKSSGVTSITLKAGTGISLDTDNTAITGTGTRTITNAGVRTTTINGNYLRVNTNGTNADLTIPYATKAGTADKLGATTVGAANHPIYLNAGVPTAAGVGDSFVSYGGQNFSDSYSPIDGLFNNKLRPNRFAGFKAAGTTIQYSNDGGSTWIDYGANDAMKVALFTTKTSLRMVPSGNVSANSQLRIIMDTGAGGTYTVLQKIMIYISTNYSSNCTVTIDAALQNSPTNYSKVICTDQPISGWSGWNVINTSLTTYGNTATSQYGRIRFTFKHSGVSSGKEAQGLIVQSIYGYGGMGWTTPSTLAATDHVYSFDQNFNVTFPATVTATTFSGNLSGNAASASSVAWSGVSGKPTTISDYGITDAKISNGIITLGSNTITPLTSHQDISGKADKSATVSTLTWDSTNKKITKTINGTTSDVVQFTAGSNVTLTGASGKLTIAATNTDTKNTAGSTDTSSKIYLIGATSQTDNPQTYSDNEVFVTSGVLTAKTFNSTSLTASQAVITDANKNLVSRGIRNNTSAGNLGWTSASTDTTLVTTNTIAYWNGAYQNTSSNLQYSKNGEIMGLSTAQTVSGTKTFSAIQKFTNTTDSTHSKDTAAAISTSGGISVEKQLSAKSIRIDDNQTSAGVQLIFDATLQALNFVFS